MESHKSEALSLFIANANEILEGNFLFQAVFFFFLSNFQLSFF